MILGYEQPVDIPVMSMYDKDMMKMYLGALREDYKDSVKAYDDFVNKYGDFVSPIDGATEAYYNAGVGGVMNKIQNYENVTGTPAIRTVEGRRMIENAIRGANIPLMNTIKASAKNKEAYDKAVRDAKLAGKYDPELERIALQKDMEARGIQYDPSQPWDNTQLWTRTSPEIYTSFEDTWKPLMKAIPKKSIQTVDPKTGLRYNQEGVFKEQVDPVIDMNFGKWISTPSGALFFDQVKQEVARQNPNSTPEQIDSIATENTKEAIRQFGLSVANPELDRGSAQINEQDWKAGENAKDRANAVRIAGIRASSSGGGAGSKNGSDESQLFANTRKRGSSFESYTPADTEHHRIQPMLPGIKFSGPISGKTPMYTMTPTEANQTMFTTSSVYSKQLSRIKLNNKFVSVAFIPSGQIHAREDANGNFRYFISGEIRVADGTLDEKGKLKFTSIQNGDRYQMEVREGYTNYGQKTVQKGSR